MSTPFAVGEVFQLNSVSGGLKPQSISYKTITLESDKYVCVRDLQDGGQSSLVIVDLEKRESMRNTVRDADSAIMNPNRKVLALRSNQQLQMFDVDAAQRLKAVEFPSEVRFWRWVDAETIGIVTDTSVFHWSASPSVDANPQRVFDRNEFDASMQVLSYRADEQKKWLMLSGITRAPEGMVGKTYLYSVENASGRLLDGHAGTFITTSTPTDSRPSNIMSLAWCDPQQGGKVLIMELPTGSKTDLTLSRRIMNVQIAAGDFPVALNASPKHKLLTVVTSRGTAILMDIFTGAVLHTQQVTPSIVFCGTAYSKSGGMLCVNNQGSVFHVSPNDSTIIPFVKNQLRNPELALRIAGSANLGGVDDLFKGQLDHYIQIGNVEEAARVCLKAPGESLRTRDNLQRFVQMGAPAGGPPAISTYFKIALAETNLNVIESAELARAVVPKGGIAFVKQQFEEGKLVASEELGDLLAPADSELAIKVYHKSDSFAKVVNLLLQRNETQKAVEYCKRADFSPDWRVILNNFVRVNPQDAVNLAMMLHRDLADKPLLSPGEVVDIFTTAQCIQQATEFLLDVLRDDNTETTRDLQTKLLEINLKFSHPSVAEKIFARGICIHYDGSALAPLCERAGLFPRAIECYILAQSQDPDVDNLSNIRRCLTQSQTFNPEWLVQFFGKLNQQDSMKCLGDLLQNHRQNFKVIVQVATKYNDALGAEQLIRLFLDQNLYDILFYYLGAIVPYTRDPEVHFRYIESAAETGQLQELERMTRESPCYDPERTKNYLKNKKLTDLWPLINVCDQHNFIDELVHYLIETENQSLIEQFVQRRSPDKTPKVVGALIECNVSEDFIVSLLNSVGTMCPIKELVEVLEEKGRLPLCLSFLEARAAEKKTDPELYSALAKIFVTTGRNPEKFLEENSLYEAEVVGKYCESRDPNLAYLAYRKGHCTEALLALTTQNGMWKQQARYLVQEQNLELWAGALASDTKERSQLVEAVQQFALPESEVSEEVSTTVRAFMNAEMTHELTFLLDQIVVHGRFRKNRFLENLLIMSAIRARQDKVMEYVKVLENFDAKDIAGIATEAGLHDEAYTIYDKRRMKKEALLVLLRDLKDLPRARTYAQSADDLELWSVLGEYLLKANEVREGISVLIKAKNPDYVEEVVAAAERTNEFGDLIKYLTMARTYSKAKNNKIDTTIVLVYAKTGRLSELEEFLKDTHNVQLQDIADKCFEDALYDSARVLYTIASSYPKLALTLVKLNHLSDAVDAAQKAKSISTWKVVHRACLDGKEMKLAGLCAVPIVLQAEELQHIVDCYERRGMWEELFAVLKTAAANPGAHMALFTEMGVILAKYGPEKLLDHINIYVKKINTHKMISVCEQYHHWNVLRVLHVNNEDWLAAAQTMMQHPGDAWDHEVFKDTVTHLGSSDVVYAAIGFYVGTNPDLVNDLLSHVFKKVDADRVIAEVAKHAPLSLIRPYLESAQERNSKVLNETLNDMFIEEENFSALRQSVEMYNNFDSAALSARLEQMEMLEFRKISLLLHRSNKRYAHAITVAKENKLFEEAIDSAAESANTELIEGLLDFFIKDYPECFVACLYTCYDYLSPPSVLQKAWLAKCPDLIMPYIIQFIDDFTKKVERMEKSMLDAQQAAKDAAKQAGPVHGDQRAPLMIPSGPQAGGYPQGMNGYPVQPPQFGSGRPY